MTKSKTCEDCDGKMKYLEDLDEYFCPHCDKDFFDGPEEILDFEE